MTRQWSRRAGAAATATVLLVLGLPARPPRPRRRSRRVPRTGTGSGPRRSTRPAPAARTITPHTAAPASRPNVPNELLAKTLFGDDDNVPEPAISALCQDYLGQPNPYAAGRTERRRDQRRHGGAGGQPARLPVGAERDPDRDQPVQPEEPRRRLERLPDLQHPGGTQRRVRLGVHDVRRWQDLAQRPAAAPDLPDRCDRCAVRHGLRRRPGHRVRAAQHRLLREHRVLPPQRRQRGDPVGVARRRAHLRRPDRSSRSTASTRTATRSTRPSSTTRNGSAPIR